MPVAIRRDLAEEADHLTYALLDPGSVSSFCSEAVLNQLGITGKEEQLCLQTLEGTGKPQASTRVKLELSCVVPGSPHRVTVSPRFTRAADSDELCICASIPPRTQEKVIPLPGGTKVEQPAKQNHA